MKKKAAVIPCKGIGDALLMMITSHHLRLHGFEVTTFHPALSELSEWFPGHTFQPEASLDKLQTYDLVVVENDNSPRIQELRSAFENKLSIFYPTYFSSKHAPLSHLDQVFKPDLSMAENLSLAVARLLSLSIASKNNGIAIPKQFIHRLYKNRVVIHPLSSQKQKNWDQKNYLKLAMQLKKKGYDPALVVSPSEREEWQSIAKKEGFELPYLANLSDLAAFVYQSGFMIGNDSLIGHLASNLSIPTCIIADDKKRMQLWRPGWLKGEVVTPPAWLPNFKFFRFKKTHWQQTISVRRVLSSFL
jgi:hypothetical protein